MKGGLLLIQIVEAVVKALEVYPIEILETQHRGGRRYVVIRAEPDNDRDKFAKKIKLSDSAVALRRLFEDDGREAHANWRISQTPNLGASQRSDVTARFVDVTDADGRHGYLFEVDEEVPADGPFFLRSERDVGAERVISRRLANIKALNTRFDLAEIARDLLRSSPGTDTSARMAIVAGESHDRIIRAASGAAERRVFVGSNRLGSTARPGAIMQGEVAATREGTQAIVLYTQNSGPLKNRHGRALAEEAASQGVRLVKTKRTPLHGKVIVWDDDNVVVTSLNRASASANPDFSWGDVGIHIEAPQIGASTFSRLCAIFPELLEAEPSN